MTDADIDIAIVRRVKAGDGEAFGELMDRYEGKLDRYLRRFLYDDHAVTDVLQDVLIKAYVHIQSFDEGYSFSSWVYRIAHNEAVNAIKKKKATPFSWFEPETLVPYFSFDDQTVEALDREALKQELDRVLDKLPQAHKEILILFFYEELSYKEIALILKIPVSSVGVRINRAKKKAFELAQATPLISHDYHH